MRPGVREAVLAWEEAKAQHERAYEEIGKQIHDLLVAVGGYATTRARTPKASAARFMCCRTIRAVLGPAKGWSGRGRRTAETDLSPPSWRPIIQTWATAARCWTGNFACSTSRRSGGRKKDLTELLADLADTYGVDPEMLAPVTRALVLDEICREKETRP